MEFPEDLISDSLEREDLGDAAHAVNLSHTVLSIGAGYSPGHPNERARQENHLGRLRKVLVCV